MSKLAADAGIPLVYVNREPINVDALAERAPSSLPNEVESGTLETKEVCRMLQGRQDRGRILVMVGELSNQAAVQRTKDIHDVIATPECCRHQDRRRADRQLGSGQGADLMTNWIAAGLKSDAVIANNDEMAIGAIQAHEGGRLGHEGRGRRRRIDATQDALADMKAGDLDVTVFQNAVGQGEGAVDAALKLAKGEKVETKV